MLATIKQHKNLFPLVFLGALSLWTIYEILFVKIEYQGTFFARTFSINHILAFLAVIINLCIYFRYRKFFRYSITITVALGLLGLLNYTADIYTLTFIVSFQLVPFLVGLAYLLLNFKLVKMRLAGTELSPAAGLNSDKVNDFKRKYQNKSNEELEKLTADTRFILEAKVAAAELLKDRDN